MNLPFFLFCLIDSIKVFVIFVVGKKIKSIGCEQLRSIKTSDQLSPLIMLSIPIEMHHLYLCRRRRDAQFGLFEKKEK
jgi:hypothetical protein